MGTLWSVERYSLPSIARLANKNTEYLVKFQFQINTKSLVNVSMSEIEGAGSWLWPGDLGP